MSDLFHFIILYVVLHIAVKNFSKPTSKNVEMGRFKRALLIESFYLTLKFYLFIPYKYKRYMPNFQSDLTFTASYEYRAYFQLLETQNKNLLKL